MAHIRDGGYVPPLEKAHRLMREGRVELKWSDVTGYVDTILRELDKAETEGEEWGKPVNDPCPDNAIPIIYQDKWDFIEKRIQPYIDRNQHLKGYIRDYAKDRAKQTQDNIELEPKANPPGHNGRQKVTSEKIQIIYQLKGEGMTQQQIADEVGVSQSLVSGILNPECKWGYIATGQTKEDNGIINIGDNITNINKTVKPTKKERGTSQGYLIGRLKRDFPDTLDKIGKDKEYKSVRAAAISMGIIKPKSPLVIPEQPEVLAANLQTKCDADYLAEVIDHLGGIAPNGDTGGQIASKLYQKLDDAQLRELYLNLVDYLGEDF